MTSSSLGDKPPTDESSHARWWVRYRASALLLKDSSASRLINDDTCRRELGSPNMEETPAVP